MPTLEPAEYWQLRALTADVDRAQLEAALAETRLDLARQRRQMYWLALTGRHGIAADRRYALRDEEYALIDLEAAPAAS